MPKWVTVEYIAACDERDFHFSEYSKDLTEAKKAHMKRSRNYCTKLRNDLKKGYFRKCLQENSGNSKSLCGTINEAFSKSKSKKHPICCINGKTDPAVMAQTLNIFFSMIADKLA